MSVETVATLYNRAAQVAMGGYPAGALVLRDGVVWKSLVANNMVPPGDDALLSWTLFS